MWWGDAQLFHLRRIEDLDVSANRSSVYVHVEDADLVHAQVPAQWGPSAVAEMQRGMREFSLTDPSGNLIRVGHHLHHDHDHSH